MCFSDSGDEIAVATLSAAGKYYYIYSEEGFSINEKDSTEWHHDDATAQLRCSDISPSLTSNFNGYRGTASSDEWRDWTHTY